MKARRLKRTLHRSALLTDDQDHRSGHGEKRVQQEEVDNWLREHNYHLPRFWNGNEKGLAKVSQTIFWQKNAHLFVFNFGTADSAAEPREWKKPT